MILPRVLEGVFVNRIIHIDPGAANVVQIRGIQYDSRKVERGDLFVAMRGSQTDGNRFIRDALERGASAVLLEDDPGLRDSNLPHDGVPRIVVPDARKALADVACNFYEHPSGKLRLIGVTGTNGKTTTTHVIKSILEAAGAKVGLIGTLVYDDGRQREPATHTTPEAPDLNRMLASMVGNGCTATVMEVSSHALALQRVRGLRFAAATFTNLTQDHLDFHGSMDEYFRAKKMLFDFLPSDSLAVTNVDDPRGREIVSTTAARRVTYGTSRDADFYAKEVLLTVDGIRMTVARGTVAESVSSPLIGGFNAQNILASYATCAGLGIDVEAIIDGITSVDGVRGRFERVPSPGGWIAIIDYAHTPDALENCLRAMRELLQEQGGKVITVFGCGGDRDRSKRPMMGRIASQLSDVTIITSDNPRSENPASIVKEVRQGIVQRAAVFEETDRRSAIRMGLAMAKKGDVVLIAGKGHETYQVIGGHKGHFDDREEVEQFIRERS